MKTLLVTLTLLTVATSASAECAWVLWSYSFAEEKGYSAYTAESARPTQRECESVVSLYVDIFTRNGFANVRSDGHMVIGDSKEGVTWKYFCLPDTVDPREAKGK